jgi:hypothetical protein
MRVARKEDSVRDAVGIEVVQRPIAVGRVTLVESVYDGLTQRSPLTSH